MVQDGGENHLKAYWNGINAHHFFKDIGKGLPVHFRCRRDLPDDGRVRALRGLAHGFEKIQHTRRVIGRGEERGELGSVYNGARRIAQVRADVG